MTQATNDCTGCPVSAGTHKPADAVHTEIAEPAPQAALAVELEAAQDMLTTARTELELLREALCVPYEPHQSLFDRMLEAAKAAGVPAAAPDVRDDLYYLQDARWASMVGNCPSFWRPDGNGYTTNLDEAARFTFSEAMAQHRCRETDLPWLCSEVDKLRRATIDCQYMPRSWDEQRAAIAAQAGKGVQ